MKYIRILVLTMASMMIAYICSTNLYDRVIEQANAQENKLVQEIEQEKTKAISSIEGNKNSIKSSRISYPKEGLRYALIKNEARDFSKDLYFGDSNGILDISIGQYSKSGIPGQEKPILLAGHNGTHFYALRNFEKGDIVQIDTDYGSFTYKVMDMEKMLASDFDVSILDQDTELLIMYTCFPFNVIDTDTRYFVYAEKVSGPVIEEDGTWKE